MSVMPPHSGFSSSADHSPNSYRSSLTQQMGCFWSTVKRSLSRSFDHRDKQQQQDSSGQSSRIRRNPRHFPAYQEISDEISRRVSRISARTSRILSSSPCPEKSPQSPQGNTYISFGDNIDPISSICLTCSTESTGHRHHPHRDQDIKSLIQYYDPPLPQPPSRSQNHPHHNKHKHKNHKRQKITSSTAMDNSFSVLDHFPSIYKITLDNHRELLDLYTEILSDTSGGEVTSKLANFVSQSIEPTDWTGIWRASVVQPVAASTSSTSCGNNSSGNSFVIKCDFEVEVIDVTHNSLEAVVILRKLLSPVADVLTTAQFDVIEEFMEKEKVKTVPLMELYVISEKDPDERLLPTAVVIEQVRFFMRFISRPWDDMVSDARGMDPFSAAKLEPRITLYFDMKHKLLPESTIKKISRILTEGRKLRKEFDDISRMVSAQHRQEEEEDMSQGDEEEDADLIDETEFYQAMRLKLKIEDLQRSLEMIEDPYMRLVATAASNEDEDSSHNEGNRVHILCKKVTKSVMQLVNSQLSSPADDETELSFHKTFAHVLRSCASGDKVLILPGVYVCDALPWIEVDVEITGLTEDPAKVLLISSEGIGDVFINCSANAIRMQNITIRTPVETQSVIMVHSGITDLVNCIVDGGKVARNTLVALSKADVAMDNCKIIHKDSTGKTPAKSLGKGKGKKNTSPPRMGICRKPGGNVSIDGTNVSFVNDDDDEEQEDRGAFTASAGASGSSQQTEESMTTTDYDSDVMSINSEVKILNTMCHKLPQAIRSDYC